MQPDFARVSFSADWHPSAIEVTAMKRLFLAGLTLAMLGSGFGYGNGSAGPGASITVARAQDREKIYCLIPEGCDINGHHYLGGQRIRPRDLQSLSPSDRES